MAEWKLRIIEHDEVDDKYLAVHEVYFNENNEVTLWSEEPIAILNQSGNGHIMGLNYFSGVSRSEVLKMSDLVEC